MPLNDKIVLEDLWRSTFGSQWVDKINWMSAGVPLSSWHGVTVDENGNVEKLVLEGNRLQGEPGALCTFHVVAVPFVGACNCYSPPNVCYVLAVGCCTTTTFAVVAGCKWQEDETMHALLAAAPI